MFARRPLIGVSGPDRGGHAAWLFTRTCLLLSGARAIRISPSRPVGNRKLDGLVLGGGADIDPAHYGDFRHKADSLKKDLSKTGTGILAWLAYPLILLFRALLSSKQYSGTDKERDSLEFQLLAQAINSNKPVLGICRGAQLINVHFGGTLYQDLAEFYTESPNVWSIFPAKEISIVAGSRLAEALGNPAKCRVNGLHKQAVKDIGKGLLITATESNNVVQAIEHDSCPFVIGVQWHPEYLINSQSQRRIFKALTNTARNQRDENRSKS
ncbi:MAG TPA: type 1 glutamine amidotransferase [Gammaproteobacteria bacterium]|nr:type 1 glutamine amidotransferase [Gammaproteobacteria bacterium]